MPMTRILTAAALVILAACSRTGTVYGDIFIQAGPGKVDRPGRIYVLGVPATEGFEREWAAAVAAFHLDVAPARQARKAAADALEEARLEWDKSLAARRTGRAGPRRRITLTWRSARDQQYWHRMLAAEHRLFTATRRVWEISRKHDALAAALLERHTAQRVLTDENGHYVLAGLPAGKGYLYTRFTVGERRLVWFRPVDVGSRPRQVDMTDANRGGWPFVP
jgi:hypothetical protein